MEILARLHLQDYGTVPTTSSIEARKLKSGFSVVMIADPELQPRPLRVGYTRRNYDWRIFAEILCGIGYEEGAITPDACPYVVADGESGIRAEILALAWGEYDYLLEWLLEQSDDSLSYIEDNIGSIFQPSNDTLLRELAECSEGLYGICDLKSRFSLHFSPRELLESMEEKSDMLLEEESGRAEQTLLPFKLQIERAVQLHGDDYRPRGGGIQAPSKSMHLQRWLQDYILEKGAFPEGEHEVNITEGFFKENLGKIYFSK